MTRTPRKIVVIGAGIAGLCTAVYARKCGYAVELVEQHESPGGLATSWRRGDYTFETCLHWLVGAAPNDAVHAQWEEVFDVNKLSFVYPEEFIRLESEDGESLSIFADVNLMELELLRKARQDAAQIRHFTSILRRFAKLAPPDPSEPWPRKGLSLLHVLPHLPLLRTLWKLTVEQYGRRFHHKLLRTFFAANSMGQLSLLALIFSLVWMGRRNAAYVVGGSQAIIGAIRARFEELGGRLRLGAKVEKILVEDGAAVGVRLAGGETIAADWVISAADGHATIYQMLGGEYADKFRQKELWRVGDLSFLSPSLARRSARAFRASRAFDARSQHAAHRRSGHGIAHHPTTFLSFRSDLGPIGQDGRHLRAADAQFRLLGRSAAAGSGALPSGERQGRGSGHLGPGKDGA